MTTQPLERTDLSIIEALDWQHEPACDLLGHPAGRGGHDAGPAWALIDNTCPSCGDGGLRYICKGRWDYAHTLGGDFWCSYCGHTAQLTDFWRFVALVRP